MRWPGIEDVLDSGHSRADAPVVGDVAGGVLRHIEIHANQHPFAAQIGQVRDGLFRHGISPS